MIDNFSLAVSHGLLLLAGWLLTRRPDLDDENATGKRGWSRAGSRRRPPGA